MTFIRRPWFHFCVISLALSAGACSDDAANNATNSANSENSQKSTNNADLGQADTRDMAVETGTTVRFAPASDDFFDRPFPSDSRLKEDGTYGFVDWPDLPNVNVGRLWLEGADDLKTGWGLTSAVFTWFNAAIDPSTLPADNAASIDIAEGYPSAFLMNVDPDSQARGELMPIECKYTEIAGTYHPEFQLACMSPYGLTRQVNTRYALVFTTDLHDAAGEPVNASADFRRVIAGEDVAGIDSAPYAETATFLAGLGIDNVASFTLFTTFDPTTRLIKVTEYYMALPEPTFNQGGGPRIVLDYDDYVVLEADYDLPVIQEGDLPYDAPPAGRLALDADGNIVKQRDESVRVFITVPKGPMPEGGFPVLFYLHGSGGKATELINRGARTVAADVPELGSGPAANIAPYGIAGFAADFSLHDSRFPQNPDTTGLKLYNLFDNPRAMIDNFMIAANEVGMHSRLMANITIDPALHPDLDAGTAADGLIRFNTDRFAAMGQSMGSMIGTPAMTIPNEIDAFINAGSGGTLIEIALTTRDPVYLNPLLQRILRFRSDEDLDRFDPVLNTLQHMFDWMDPYVHARHVIFQPQLGASPRHLFHPSGLEDRYFSPDGRAGLSTALGAPLVDPVLEDYAFEYMKWRNLTDTVQTPVQGNLMNGAVTGFVRQFEPAYPEAGHYVVFDKPEARAQYACFVKSLNADDPPVLRSPEDSSVANCP